MTDPKNQLRAKDSYASYHIAPSRSARYGVIPMDRATVQRVAKVARLRLSEEELGRYAQDLEEILNSFDVLDQAPSRESNSFNPVPVEDVTREDEVACDIDPQKLRDSMDTYEGYVRGPKLQ